MRLQKRLAVVLLSSSLASPVLAEPDDVIDFSEQTTAICEVVGLTAPPPSGWFNVAIDSDDEALSGCQMMRAGDQEELVGIIRLVSVTVEEEEDSPPWYAVMIAIEQQIIGEMGYELGEVMWSRQDVPISGEGFANARAVGLSASIKGNDTPQEVHFLLFEHGQQKFIITLLTPGRDVDEGVFYKRNTDDFGILIRSLNRKSS
jgi:hypothetical protein